MSFLNLVQNKYTLNNNFLSLNSEEGTFWQFLQPQKDYFSNSDLIETFPISVSFLGQVTLREYEVNYYSFWEFIGQLGGFYEILELLGMFFIGFYNQNLLNTDLLNWHQTNINQKIENRCNQIEPHGNLSDRNNDRDQNPELKLTPAHYNSQLNSRASQNLNRFQNFREEKHKYLLVNNSQNKFS